MALSQREKYERAWVKALARRPLTAFERALQDPQLVSLRQELALVDDRVAELHQRAATGEAPVRWRRAQEVAHRLARLLDEVPIDRARVDHARDELLALADEAAAERAAWDETTTLIELRRRLADTERKYEEQQQLLVPVGQLLFLFDNLHHAIEAVIPDRALQVTLLRLVREKCNRDFAPRGQPPVTLALPEAYVAAGAAAEPAAGEGGASAVEHEPGGEGDL